MEQVINRMFKIEEKANDIINRTTEQKQQLLLKHNRAIDQLKLDISHDSEKKLSLLQANMKKEIMKQRTILTQECTQELNALDDNYKEHHDILVESVFEKIISF